MSRSFALVSGSPVSTMPQNHLRATWKANKDSGAEAQDKAFSSMLHYSIGEGIRAALGQAILAVLNDQGLFEKAQEPKEFHRKLQNVFGNGAAVIEKIIIKDLFRKLNVSYVSSEYFNYADDLERARQACTLEGRAK
jgi:hypothetical protein